MSFSNNTLQTSISGAFDDGLPLANLTIAGIKEEPKSISVTIGGKEQRCSDAMSAFADGVLTVTNLESATKVAGIWSGDVVITLNRDHGSWGGRGGHWGPPHWEADW